MVHSCTTPGLLLQLQGPAACPSPGAVPDARPVLAAADELNSDAILTLALLTCGLVAALTFRVVLQCALRVTRGACCGGADDAQDDDDDPEEQEQVQQHAGGGAGPAQLQAAARHGHAHGRKQPRRLPPALVQALPYLAFSAGLEMAGSSRSECAICLTKFARGEAVRVLPRCNHGFHARCIDRWLTARPTCPTSRRSCSRHWQKTTHRIKTPDCQANL
ncbi:RING-H2 finger protein ATL72-like [Miscanthus floridulus]|uniref:RING-H2 finger protein ATL72-like n=1 Tax=Miscanthus floridulus TaxID=154761 RepID=UPI0034598673